MNLKGEPAKTGERFDEGVTFWIVQFLVA